MALSYSIGPEVSIRKNPAGLIPVLLTGANGNIGRYFAEHKPDDMALKMTVRDPDDEDAHALKKFGDVVAVELHELDKLKEVCAGIDTVIHMAGESKPEANWDSLLQNNIIGTYNMMVAARAAGCRRFIYASSIHAVSGYPPDVQVKSSDPVNPGDLYGVSKCFSEALGRYMAEQEGLSVICIRIGAFQPLDFARSPDSTYAMDAWVSERDLAHLLDVCVRDCRLKFAVFNGLSDNRFKRLDITDARELVGYRPADDVTEMNPELKDLHLDEKVSSHSLADDPAPEKSGIRDEV